ncbi:unnamed protein product [Caenorhabditis bovis]|uniref:Sulfotransferase domain-containing protein n=1 Tax=Caenorhabditis bovis TaxID=2654633 RepID=A0A8S1EWM4_9PELO|nr:unnamed protein product [Caenorhabditis bovis]
MANIKVCDDPLEICAGVVFKQNLPSIFLLSDVDFNKTLIPPYYNYLQDFFVSKKKNISFCLVTKVMSTIGTAMFCYLENPEKFIRSNRTLSKEKYEKRSCKSNEVKYSALIGNRNNLIVTRHPIERFISGFADKCRSSSSEVCHGCKRDVRCFIRKEYRRLMRISMFLPVYTMEDTHFAPQTWFCDMKNRLHNSTVIQYPRIWEDPSRMTMQIIDFFRKNNVDSKRIDEISKQLQDKTSHATVGTSFHAEVENLVWSDPSIRLALIRMYYYDFVELGYEIPW